MTDIERVRDRLAPHGLSYGHESIFLSPHNVELTPGWCANGNRLYLGEGVTAPMIVFHPGLPPSRNAIVAVASGTKVERIVLWGEAPILCFGQGAILPETRIACGDRSTVIVGDGVSTSGGAQLNARNGGLISVGADGLWAENVVAYTDDMHAIRDAVTGDRVNPFGGVIIIEPHVWLGYEALVLRSARIGRDAVVGARSVVTGDLPSSSICAGAPARPTRLGVTWDHADTAS